MARTKITRYCVRCGTQVKRPRAKYCSYECSWAGQLKCADELFWKKVDISGECWLWQSTHRSGGYGNFVSQSKSILAHRYSYELVYGPIPEGLFVLHSCDVKLCVRPTHLSVGTQLENMQQCKARGRTPFGEKQGQSKLTDADVRKIRTMYASGEYTFDQLAEIFPVRRHTISKAVRRLTWAHIN